MKILVITSKEVTGLNYHRQLIPHKHLSVNYSYDVTYAEGLDVLTDKELKEFEVVTFLRIVDTNGNSSSIIQRAKDAGCKTILDIDDYWKLPNSHGLAQTYIDNKIEKQTLESVSNVDWVTTTTEHFADKLKDYNENVVVIPNSIWGDEDQFAVRESQSDRVRFGWIGGVFHLPDIKLLHEGFKDVWSNVNNDKFQLCLGGYNFPDKYQYVCNVLANGDMDKQSRSKFEYYKKELFEGRDIPDVLIFNNVYNNIPQYDLIEFYFTFGGKYPKDEEYKKYLEKKKQEDLHIMDSQPYKRLWGKSAAEYATLYNDIDVSLVPLVESNFNSFKSQIKIIEAGWFKKAAIVSNVMPYTIDCNRSNSILISPSKRNDGWGTAIKSLILNPNKREDLAEQLHEDVKSKYDMNIVNKVRHDLYQKLKQ